MSVQIAVALALMMVLLFIKVPVFLSIIGGTAVYFLLNPDVGSMILGQRLVSSVQSLSLLAIPFFVCSGVFMNYSGVTRRIMALCDILLQYDIAKISLRRMEMDAVLFLHRRPVRDLLYLSGDGRAEFTAEK